MARQSFQEELVVSEFFGFVIEPYAVVSAACEVGRLVGFYSASGLRAYGPGGWMAAMCEPKIPVQQAA